MCTECAECWRELENGLEEREAKARAQVIARGLFAWMDEHGREPELESEDDVESWLAMWLADMREAKAAYEAAEAEFYASDYEGFIK